MENEYLYRGKRIDNGEWVKGNLIQSCDATDGWETIIIPVKNSNMFTKHIGHGYGNLGFENWYRVDPSTICQCTGLRDKNGKLIYENDIVRVCWQDNEAQCEEIAQVAWDKFGYYPWLDEYHCDGCDLFNEVRDIEVIGNRFDNPELLEE